MAHVPETLTFTTPTRERLSQPVPVTLCGEDIGVIRRPKDAVLYFAQTVVAGDVVGPDRAGAILQFLNSALDHGQRHRYFQRVIDRDDPLDLRATLDMLGGLAQRWGNWPTTGEVEPVVATPAENPPQPPAPIRIVNDLGLDFLAHPPKDVVLLFTAASLATGSNAGQQAWAVGLFLDSALPPQDALVVSGRMRDTDDDLELRDIAEIVTELVGRWDLGTNRATRRARALSAGCDSLSDLPLRGL